MKYSEAVTMIIERYTIKKDNFAFALISQILCQSFWDEDATIEKLDGLPQYLLNIMQKAIKAFLDEERLQCFLLLNAALEDPIRERWDVLAVPFMEQEQDPGFKKRTELSRDYLNKLRFRPTKTEDKIKYMLRAVFLNRKNENADYDCRQLLKELLRFDCFENIPDPTPISKEPEYQIRVIFSDRLDNENNSLLDLCCEYMSGDQNPLLEAVTTALLQETPIEGASTLTLLEETFQRSIFKTTRKHYNFSEYDEEYSDSDYIADDEISTLFEYRGSVPVYYSNIPQRLLDRAAFFFDARRLNSAENLDYHLGNSEKKIIIILHGDETPEKDADLLFEILEKRTYKGYRIPAQSLIAIEIKKPLPEYLQYLKRIAIHC